MSQENVELVREAYGLDLFTASSDTIDRYFRDYADEAFEFTCLPITLRGSRSSADEMGPAISLRR